jgi:hypothetical protein
MFARRDRDGIMTVPDWPYIVMPAVALPAPGW